MTDEIREVSVICGPYAGRRLTMPAADAETAINDHWARDPHSGVPYGEGHEPLSEEERTHAMEAADAWAKTAWAAANIPGAEPPDPPPPEGTMASRQGMRPGMVEGETPRQRMQREQRESEQQRAMRPEDAPGYKTR